MIYFLPLQTQQLQMQPMSRQDVNPGATETQQMRITAPVGVSMSSVSQPSPFSPIYTDRPRYFLENRRAADSFSFTSGSPISDYVYEYRTRRVDDPSKTRWTFPGFPQVSRDKGGFVCTALHYTALACFPPRLSCCRNPIVDCQLYIFTGTYYLYVRPKQHS